jgi:hypothetical protein
VEHIQRLTNFRLVPIDHQLGLLATELALNLQLRGADAIYVVVLLSIEEYQRLQAQRIGFWQAFNNFQSKFDLQELSIEPEIFTAHRDDAPGREVFL